MDRSFSQKGKRSAFKILTGTATGNILLGRPRRRWGVNIRMDLKEIGINTRNRVDSAQGRDFWRDLANFIICTVHLIYSG